MLAGENSMNNGQNAPSDPKKDAADPASGSLADSSVNEAPATPGGPPARDEGRHKIPQNDQLDGLQKAEQAGKQPARPGPRP
jgi:hypothetical protein